MLKFRGKHLCPIIINVHNSFTNTCNLTHQLLSMFHYCFKGNGNGCFVSARRKFSGPEISEFFHWINTNNFKIQLSKSEQQFKRKKMEIDTFIGRHESIKLAKESFEKRFRENQSGWRAAEDGPLYYFQGGPGSGKTRLLFELGNKIESWSKVERIDSPIAVKICLTFSDTVSPDSHLRAAQSVALRILYSAVLSDKMTYPSFIQSMTSSTTDMVNSITVQEAIETVQFIAKRQREYDTGCLGPVIIYIAVDDLEGLKYHHNSEDSSNTEMLCDIIDVSCGADTVEEVVEWNDEVGGTDCEDTATILSKNSEDNVDKGWTKGDTNESTVAHLPKHLTPLRNVMIELGHITARPPVGTCVFTVLAENVDDGLGEVLAWENIRHRKLPLDPLTLNEVNSLFDEMAERNPAWRGFQKNEAFMALLREYCFIPANIVKLIHFCEPQLREEGDIHKLDLSTIQSTLSTEVKALLHQMSNDQSCKNA